MSVVTMKNLLESGVHFGHQTRRWDPRMAKFIFSERNGIHIIDLQKTIVEIKKAYDAIRKVVLANKPVLFVGTKKQARAAIQREAERCNQFYVNNRWLGGMLTNFSTIKKSIVRLKKIEKMEVDGTFDSITKKEKQALLKEKEKLEKNLGGIKNMPGLPGILFVIDSKKEAIAVAEAKKLGIPVVAIVDTNCNPDVIDYPIPGNDDAIRAINLFCSIIASACIDADNEAGANIFSEIENEEINLNEKILESVDIINKDKIKEADNNEEGEEDEFIDIPKKINQQKEQEKTEEKVQKKEEKNPKVEKKENKNEKIEKKENKKDVKVEKKEEEKTNQEEKLNKKDEIKSSSNDKNLKNNSNEKKGEKMETIKASDVKKLREITNAGMMDCKKALEEANGDFDQALKLLKEKGLADAKKRSDRETKEGGVYIKSDSNYIAIIQMGCETDFVSGNEKFKIAANNILDKILKTKDSNIDSYKEDIQELINQTKENIELKKLSLIEVKDNQFAQSYIHSNNKIGVVTIFDINSKDIKTNNDFIEFTMNICMHIAASSPFYLTDKDVPEKEINEQKSIFEKQMEGTDKPANVIENIIKGKISKYLQEICLLDQKFVKDDKITVKKYIEDVSKKLGVEIKISSFIRYNVGA